MDELKKQQGILRCSKTTEILDQIRDSAKNNTNCCILHDDGAVTNVTC